MKAIKLTIFSMLTLIIFNSCQIINNVSDTLLSENPDIVVESPELTSIFLGYDIFMGNGHDRDQNPYIGFDLRYNLRFLDFVHPIFSANKVTDKDIINWITVYLYGEIFLPWNDTIGIDYGLDATPEQEQALLQSNINFDPLEGQPWGIILLDNGSELSISLEGATHTQGDTFIIAYRSQVSDAPIQSSLDWFDIAYGSFILGNEAIEWYGFIENSDDNHILSTLKQSPFE